MYTKTEQEPGNEARHGRGRQIHLFAINYSPIIWIIKKSRSVAQHHMQLTRFSSSTACAGEATTTGGFGTLKFTKTCLVADSGLGMGLGVCEMLAHAGCRLVLLHHCL